jgi:hypothetical protein
MFTHWKDKPPPNERKFYVFKREANGRVVRVGAVVASNKVQADTRARMIFGKMLSEHEAVWAVDPEAEDADTDKQTKAA